MNKWQTVAVIAVLLMVTAAVVVWMVLNKASKTLDKAKTTAEATERFTSNVSGVIDSGKRIWELFSNGE